MISFSDFYHSIIDSPLEAGLPEISLRLNTWQNQKSQKDLKRWLHLLDQLPEITPHHIDLVQQVKVGTANDLTPQQHQQLVSILKLLSPWRKGPFDVFDIVIDAEWQSDWKWKRIQPYLQGINNARVLDVGCGNGYYMWRMLGLGANYILGVDPMNLFFAQFLAIQHFMPFKPPVHFLPLTLEDLPPISAFDYVFSMGVLSHRRSPIDHLLQLKAQLKPTGTLILETLVIEGDATSLLMPPDRYANMHNVWFIPSVSLLTTWLERCQFKHIQLLDVTTTSVQEQKATSWSNSFSLVEGLNADQTKTCEGLAPPMRACIIAQA